MKIGSFNWKSKTIFQRKTWKHRGYCFLAIILSSLLIVVEVLNTDLFIFYIIFDIFYFVVTKTFNRFSRCFHKFSQTNLWKTSKMEHFAEIVNGLNRQLFSWKFQCYIFDRVLNKPLNSESLPTQRVHVKLFFPCYSHFFILIVIQNGLLNPMVQSVDMTLISQYLKCSQFLKS